jgi:hypothetical protein
VSAYDGRIGIGGSDVDELGITTLTAVKLPCVGGILVMGRVTRPSRPLG